MCVGAVFGCQPKRTNRISMNETLRQQDVPQKRTWWWRYSRSSALEWPRRRTGTSDWPSHCWLRSPPPAAWRCKGDVFLILGQSEDNYNAHLRGTPAAVSHEWWSGESETVAMTLAVGAGSVSVDVVSVASPAGCSTCFGLWSSCSSWSHFEWLDLSSVNRKEEQCSCFLGCETSLYVSKQKTWSVYLPSAHQSWAWSEGSRRTVWPRPAPSPSAAWGRTAGWSAPPTDFAGRFLQRYQI